MEFLALLLVASLIVRGYSDTIQCYKCKDCKELDDSLLQSCPPDSDTTNTPITDESTTTSSTTNTDDLTTTTSSMSTTTDLPPTVDPTDPTEDPEEIANLEMQSVIHRTSRQVDYKSLMMRRSTRDSPSYHCYSIEIDEEGVRKTIKDCVEVPENKNPCEVLTVQYGESVKDCKICSENKCNSSGVLKFSLLVFVIVIVLDLFY